MIVDLSVPLEDNPAEPIRPVVERQDHASGTALGQVTTATAGTPIEGAKVQTWIRHNNGGWAIGQEGTTGKDGLYSIPVPRDRGHMVVVTHNGQLLATANDAYSGGERPIPHVRDYIAFFTDRSLYRPGQTIHFKGIVMTIDQGRDNYHTIPNRPITVLFADVNGKEVSRLQTK